MHKIFNGLVGTTAVKYLITILATALAQYLGVSEGEVTGILTQLVAVLMGAWGVWESTRNKAVLNGEVTRIPPSKVNQTAVAVEKVVVNDKGDTLVGRVR